MNQAKEAQQMHKTLHQTRNKMRRTDRRGKDEKETGNEIMKRIKKCAI